MKFNKNVSYIIITVLALSTCAPPPIPTPMPQSSATALDINNKKDRSNLSFKRLDTPSAKLKIDNSKVIITFNENDRTIEHQLIVGAYDLGENSYFPGWEFSTSSRGILIDDIISSCEIKKDDDTSSENSCTATKSINPSNENMINFKYEGKIYNGEKLIINYKYNQDKETQDILYKQEAIVIPLITDKYMSFSCDYKFIIPDGYINLGLKDNLLTKESETTYVYNADCPTTSIKEIIRYSPEEVMWKADTELSLKYTPKFTNDVMSKQRASRHRWRSENARRPNSERRNAPSARQRRKPPPSLPHRRKRWTASLGRHSSTKWTTSPRRR